MQLDRFLQSLVHRWYLVFLPTLVGLLSAYAYFTFLGTNTAAATVAVMEPAVTRAMTSTQAQVTFSAVAESYRVAERVIAKLNLDMEPRDLKDSVSVKLSRSLVANLSAPLYLVNVQHKDSDTAMKLADAVVVEARQVFAELNALDPAQLDATFQAQESRLRADAAQARAELRAVEDAHQVWMLPALLNAHMSILTGLQQGTYTMTTSQSATAALRAEVQRNLNNAQAEQSRLRSLQSEYDRLMFDFSLASNAVAQETGRVRDFSLAGDPALRATAEAQLAAAKAQLESTRAAVGVFKIANKIGDLPTDLMTQTAQVSEMRSRLITLGGEPGSSQQAIEAERQEISRLSALMPRYEELTTTISSAEGRLNFLENRKLELTIAGIVAPMSYVKTLDTARIEPQVLWNVVVTVLGAMLGVLTGVVLVYLVAYFDRTPRTTDDVENLLGFPVLARLPRAQ